MDEDIKPPLPVQEPPALPSPPPSEQTSNQNNELLDFSHDCGGSLPQPSGSPPPKRRKIKQEPGVALAELGEYESLEEGELEESDGDFTGRKSITPVMVLQDGESGSRDMPPDSTQPEEDEGPPDSPTHEIISFIGETIDKNAKPTSATEGPTEFEIIDDLGSDGEEGNAEEGDEEDEFSMDEDEIDAMLDGGMAEYQRTSGARQGGSGSNPPVEKEKVVLKEKSHDPFDILPEGWVVVTHNSGMPVYLHKQSRVCTLSRPYFLGPGSARKHEIPLSAIPCLSYRRALEREKDEAENPESSSTNENIPQQNGDISDNAAEAAQSTTSQKEDQDGKGGDVPSVKVESAEDHKKVNNLNPQEVQEYCKSLFEFKTITVKRFKTWKDRRRHNTAIKKASRPLLPSATKLITCPIPSEKDDAKSSRKKEFVLNPTGKSHVCILHEYVQHAMRVQPRYIFKEIENGSTPYSATVVIGDVQYGTGLATSKKAAKIEAARKTLEVLIPQMNKVTEETQKREDQDVSFFDNVKIEDPRVTELFMKAGQPSPFQILYECLKRNYGVGDTQVQMDMKAIKHQRSEFNMKVGKHEAKVTCKNKREGKQFAAQAILQMMHPHVHAWGSLLRLYGRGSGAKEKKDESMTMSVTGGWEGEMIVDTSAPYWDQRRDREHYSNITRSVEIMTVIPRDPPVKTEVKEEDAVAMETDDAGQGDAGKGEEAGKVVLERTEPVTVKAAFCPLQRMKMMTSGDDVVTLKAGEDETLLTTLLHAAVQTDTPQGICLVVGDIIHRATQTEWEGNLLFHKAVQHPEVSYNKEESESKSAPGIKPPGSYTTSTGQRKQVVLVTKPDGGVTSVSLAPKTYETVKPAGEKEENKPPTSPLQGASNVYFASGAIKPYSAEEKEGLIGPLYKDEGDEKGEKSLKFIPRNVNQKKSEEKTESSEASGTTTASTTTSSTTISTTTPISSRAASVHSSPITSSSLSDYAARHAAHQPVVIPASRPQMMLAGAQLGMPGAGLMGSMPATMARPQLGLPAMAGLTTGMEHLYAGQTAAAGLTGQSVLSSMYYPQLQGMQGLQGMQQSMQSMQGMQGVQQPVVYQQPQPQPMYYYDPTTGQVVFQQM